MCVCARVCVFVSQGIWVCVCDAVTHEYCYEHVRLAVQNKGMFTRDLLFARRVKAVYLQANSESSEKRSSITMHVLACVY